MRLTFIPALPRSMSLDPCDKVWLLRYVLCADVVYGIRCWLPQYTDLWLCLATLCISRSTYWLTVESILSLNFGRAVIEMDLFFFKQGSKQFIEAHNLRGTIRNSQNQFFFKFRKLSKCHFSYKQWYLSSCTIKFSSCWHLNMHW